MSEIDTSLPTPEIPPKREGHSRSSSAAFSNSEPTNPSRWSFPASLYRNSAIIEMGEAFPLEIGGLEGMQEISLNQPGKSNRNSASSFSTSLPLPWQENVSHVTVPPGAPASFSGPLDPPPPQLNTSYIPRVSKDVPVIEKVPIAASSGITSTESPLTPPSRVPRGAHQHTLSDAYVSSQESVEDLKQQPTKRTNRTPKSPLHPTTNSPGSPSPENVEKLAGGTGISPSEMRKSENLRKLQRIINSDDEEDVLMQDVENLSYITAADTPAMLANIQDIQAKDDQTSKKEAQESNTNRTSVVGSIRDTPHLRSAVRQPSGPRPEPPSSKGTPSSGPPNSPPPKPFQSATGIGQGSPRGVAQGSPQTPSQHKFPERSSSRRRRLDTSGLALRSDAGPTIDREPQAGLGHVRSPSSPERGKGATEFKSRSHSHSQSVPTTYDQHPQNPNKNKHKRNFTKKSLENMMEQNPSPYDIADIGLPRPERLLLEKFIDSLSKLSIEVQMDEGKREEGRRRLNNALRALEGWF